MKDIVDPIDIKGDINFDTNSIDDNSTKEVQEKKYQPKEETYQKDNYGGYRSKGIYDD